MHTTERFDNLGRNLQSASRTLSGTAAARLIFDGADGQRLGVLLHNHSTTLKVFAKLSRLLTGETVSATDKHLVIQPETTVIVRAGQEIQLWAMNSSGDATTSVVDALEVR